MGTKQEKKVRLLTAIAELHAFIMKQKIRNTIDDFEKRIARIEVIAEEAGTDRKELCLLNQ